MKSPLRASFGAILKSDSSSKDSKSSTPPTTIAAVSKPAYSPHIRDYELIADIGGVGDISYLYHAKYTPTGEMVALKYTDLSLSQDYELVDEVIRTIKNASMCSHKNILPYHTSFIESERLWSVTPSIGTCSLRGLIRDYFPDGFQDDAVIATILRELLEAIVYLHDNHMIHNDVRADNVLLDSKGGVKVTGLRQLVSLTQDGGYLKDVFSILSDNIEWAAPEIMAQHSNFDEKVDIYSFGITAMELAFGKTPFDDWSPLKILLSKLDYDCPGIKTTRTMPISFMKMVKACIRKNPKERPSAKDLLLHPYFNYASPTTDILYTSIVKHVKENPKS
ncbi:UNVERIFIED_CONTAM: hypothetical protein HDU68_001729 [Siphonaria sp. JEL0065]|nr:hypothetical protein HDU68_001729 [Siphonaria sp. JEL0065]